MRIRYDVNHLVYGNSNSLALLEESYKTLIFFKLQFKESKYLHKFAAIVRLLSHMKTFSCKALIKQTSERLLIFKTEDPK